jgi:hypothetical protein
MRKIGASDLNINTALIIGAAVGAYFFVLKPILEKTGIKKTAAEEAEEKAAEELKNIGIWNTQESLLKKYPNGTTFKLLTVSIADQLAKNIYNSWSYINDDEEKVYAQFRALNYQSQVSSLVNAYYRLYNKDLYQTLYTKLSDSELRTITNIISNKPSGIQK